MSEEYADITCQNCETVLLLRYERLAVESPDKHPVGCPECQSTTSVVAAWNALQQAAAPQFLHLTALKKKTEIGLAAAMPARIPAFNLPHTDEPPMTPGSKGNAN